MCGNRSPLEYTVAPAQSGDVPEIARQMEPLVEQRILLGKDPVSLYEALPEFMVAKTVTGEVIGFGALHVMWQHLGEIRTLAVPDAVRGSGVGSALLRALEAKAVALGLQQLVSLTFETEFFGRHGYREIGEKDNPVDDTLYRQLLLSHDEGVAEFLDLARVKPNTLGNTRMMKVLTQ